MLNNEQQLAATTYTGPLRIIAGAGTGKTHTLIHRILFLIDKKNVNPSKILTLTFTKKAALGLKERLQENKISNVKCMTFHSLAAMILRKFWKKEFTIIDSSEQKKIFQQILNKKEFKKLDDYLNDLNILRFNELLEKEHKYQPQNPDIYLKRLIEILNIYEKHLSAENKVDFNGLLLTLLKLWNEKPNILAKSQKLFDYVLVDEYQDVNKIQIEILEKLVRPHKNICVVGDSDQTIYSWRGAKAGTMMDFEKIFEYSQTVVLTKNYRNPPSILNGAQKLIKNNKGRIAKYLEPTILKDNKIVFYESLNEFEQSEILLSVLEKYFGSTSSMTTADDLDTENNNFKQFSDIALLYRTQSQGKILAEFLQKKGYPYQISNSEYFWQKKEIIQFIKDLNRLLDSYSEKLKNIETSSKFSEWFLKFIDLYIEKNTFSKNQQSRLKHLIPYSLQFDYLDINEALKLFLDDVKIYEEADNLIYGDRINLLTLHAAKGLEFPVVIIFGLEEDNIPYKKSLNDSYLLSEERRLLYVGMTRATEELYLLYKKKYKDKEMNRSRFLSEIGIENMIYQTLPEKRKLKIKRKKFKEAQMTLF